MAATFDFSDGVLKVSVDFSVKVFIVFVLFDIHGVNEVGFGEVEFHGC
jgi:hypothetical protein